MKAKLTQAILGGMVLLAAMAVPAGAVSINITTSNPLQQDGPTLTGFATLGSGMAGMTVKATFAGGTTQTAVWSTTGFSSGGASSAGWFSLALDGDSFDESWSLSNDSNLLLTELWIDAGTGDTVFDRTWNVNGDDEGTPGSARGRDFAVTSGLGSSDDASTINVKYSGIVALDSNQPVGDLWRYLSVDFSDLARGGIVAGQSLGFGQDTDSIDVSDGGGLQEVPEPGTYALMGAGLLALAALRRK